MTILDGFMFGFGRMLAEASVGLLAIAAFALLALIAKFWR